MILCITARKRRCREIEYFGADMLYTEVDKLRDQLEMGYPNLKWVIPVYHEYRNDNDTEKSIWLLPALLLFWSIIFVSEPSFAKALTSQPIIGAYISPILPDADLIRLKDWGYNMLEFVDVCYAYKPEGIKAHHKMLNEAISRYHAKGFKVYIILMTTMNQNKEPKEPFVCDSVFSPISHPELYKERLSYLQASIKNLRKADGFTLIAGDPGGDPECLSGTEFFIKMARDVKMLVRKFAPKADFIINTWSIAAWENYPSPYKAEYWQKEIIATRKVINAPDLLDSSTGIEIPAPSNFYQLALNSLTEENITPEIFPTTKDFSILRSKGVKHIWSWPFGLVSNEVAPHKDSQSEIRYIARNINLFRQLGANRFVCTIYSGNMAGEALNTFAFSRLGSSATMTAKSVTDEWAGFEADQSSHAALARVIRFIENHSDYENIIPLQFRYHPLTQVKSNQNSKL
ncbi:MAG: hypothetical protein ACYC0V_13255 [Armatimonadota bacterium]